MSRERMSSVDTAWLRMDSPQNLMMIVGILVFETPISYEDLCRALEHRLLAFKRFSQRVESNDETCWWVGDSSFDIRNHLVATKLPKGDGEAQMRVFVADLAAQPLDPLRPLWQFHLVQNYLGKQALVARIHHCIGDGIALVAVMLSLTDRDNGKHPEADDHPSFGEDHGELESNPWRPYVKQVERRTISAINVTEALLAKAMQVLAHPDRLAEFAEIGSHVIKDALSIALMPDDSPTSLKGIPGTAKVVAWNEPLPLEEIKAVSRALGASINDVLLSCVAGALRSYLLAQDGLPDDCEIRAMVPVNLRPLDKAHELGNMFGLVPLCLPVGIANPIARLREVRRRMNELKGGYQAMLAFGVLGLVGLVPKPVQKLVLDTLANKATAVMTNVPGPRQPIYLAGSQISRIMVWVPQSGNVGMGVSILSYNGGVQFGLITDTLLCPDPQKIIDAFAPEFEKLVMMLSLLPREMFMDSSLDPEVFEEVLFGDGARV